MIAISLEDFVLGRICGLDSLYKSSRFKFIFFNISVVSSIILVTFSITSQVEYFVYMIIFSFGFVQYPWIESVDSTVAIFEWNVISKDYKM